MDLREYVKSIMDEKNFGVRDVERASGNRISASHVSKILNGSAGNLTADKIVGLALGLGVDPHEVFSVISGHALREESPPDLVKFTGLMQKLAANLALLGAVEELVRFDKKDQAKALEMLKFVNTRKELDRRRKKR